MPQTNAILDCSPIAAAGHVIPQRYGPVSVSQFMDDLSAEEDVLCTHLDKDNNCVSPFLVGALLKLGFFATTSHGEDS